MVNLLQVLNAPKSPFRSIGCETAFFDLVPARGEARVYLGSYTDFTFVDADRANETELVELAQAIAARAEIEGERDWVQFRLGVQPFKMLFGRSDRFGIVLNVEGYGRDRNQALLTWNFGASKLAKAIIDASKELGVV